MSKDFAEARARGEAANEIDALRTALTAATERAERAEADLTAARALLREVLPWLDTEFFEEDRELHGRVVAYLEGR